MTGAFAYFTGGAMQKAWGRQSMFFVPAGLLFLEMIFSFWLEKQVNRQPPAARDDPAPRAAPAAERRASPVPARTFLKMGWLANPLAYLAINTIIATIPTLARHFHLSEALAGVVCSVWLFSRAGAFVLLWLWPGWHYRFRFLAGRLCRDDCLFRRHVAGGGPLGVGHFPGGFGFDPRFDLLFLAVLFHGRGRNQGRARRHPRSGHRRRQLRGPAIAAAALLLFPAHPSSGTLAVCLLLLCGLGGLFWLRYKTSASAS